MDNKILISSDGISNSTIFGENVYVFDSSMDVDYIQNICDEIFRKQEANHFGNERCAIFFKPGEYQSKIKIGFYTHIAGLGKLPSEVNIFGGIDVDAAWRDGNALCNFWRSCENISISPEDGTSKWAVSQASPLRRVHIKGNLSLFDGGWSSGGFLSDSVIDGEVISGTQQQWFSRNNKWGNWNGGGFNMVFVGDMNPPEGEWPAEPYTVIDKTPVIREKPFLTIDKDGRYSVFVPEVRFNSLGTTWDKGEQLGKYISIDEFYIAKPDNLNIKDINTALSRGKNLIFTPGIYHIDETIKVKKSNTIVLGLGFATLLSMDGVTAMSVEALEGVMVSGILFDAGTVNSPILMEVGGEKNNIVNFENPIVLSDIFFRVGGADSGNADVCLKINSNNVIGDHFWVWRADHGTGVGWTKNTTSNGVIVDGDDVILYALMVEHYHKYQVIWNGERGKTYFYQSELPYDVPEQRNWMSGKKKGYASYKVADLVKSHEAFGLGVYSYIINTDIALDSAIEVPINLNVKIHNAITVFLNGNCKILNIVNNEGSYVDDSVRRRRITHYPEEIKK